MSDARLEAFYASRRRATVVICVASLMQATLLGSSVLIEGLTQRFDEPGHNYAFHGLYAKVLVAPVANSVAGQLMWTFKSHPEWKEPILSVGVLLGSVGFALSGAGASVCAATERGSAGGVALLYIGMTGFVGVCMGVLELVIGFWGLLYWCFRRADLPRTGRGDAAAATWTFGRDQRAL